MTTMATMMARTRLAAPCVILFAVLLGHAAANFACVSCKKNFFGDYTVRSPTALGGAWFSSSQGRVVTRQFVRVAAAEGAEGGAGRGVVFSAPVRVVSLCAWPHHATPRVRGLA